MRVYNPGIEFPAVAWKETFTYLHSANSTESCDTSYSSGKEKMEVVGTAQLYEGESRASNEDINEDWKRRFLEKLPLLSI